MAQLTPLTRNALFSRLVFNGHQIDPSTDRARARGRVETVYRCTECREVHDWEDDAEACCADEVHPEESAPACPVCSSEFSGHRDAVDCCLWKDFDAPTRWRIADAVENGSDWITEIKSAASEIQAPA